MIILKLLTIIFFIYCVSKSITINLKSKNEDLEKEILRLNKLLARKGEK
jgi:hypothetical protein